MQDLATLQAISIETYTDTFGEFNTPANTKAYIDSAYDLTVLKTEMLNVNSEFYFMYLDEQLAGYLKVNILDAQSELMADDFLEIQRIYIRKPFKRLGLGKKLLELGLDRAQALQKKRVWLGVWEKNFPAQKFYRQMGFERYSEHKFVMGDSVQTDYILKKDLR
ncbi:protease synthase and sporulation negative regulatory protein pai 1 [Companilactobacillus kimchiensis]|uniref:Protease synthase and sporulation negative regulatory protein pai 1 n=1 Tax=Companilactobacillus kimchiensis TaxID=993692 RepID=A0A0R2LGZ6_9LACO|nr:protease synthase and sporulation negative regulatory protein pai 1 [Companilactobacillus kimchiensis]